MTNATCELGTLLGHDGDECRAQRCSDGHIHCHVCGMLFGRTAGWVGPSTIDALRNVLGRRSTITQTPTPQGLDNRFAISFAPFITGNLVYERADMFDLPSDDTVGRDFVAAEFAGIPPQVVEVATNLAKLGYRVMTPLEHFGEHAMRTICMVRGRGPFVGVFGVQVELTYIVG